MSKSKTSELYILNVSVLTDNIVQITVLGGSLSFSRNEVPADLPGNYQNYALVETLAPTNNPAVYDAHYNFKRRIT